MNDDTRMADYVRKCDELDASDKTSTHRDSPFFRALSYTFLTTPCGCSIVGDGNLPSPLRIKFCAMHAARDD